MNARTLHSSLALCGARFLGCFAVGTPLCLPALASAATAAPAALQSAAPAADSQSAAAVSSPSSSSREAAPRSLDLATALRLAGARNLDVQIARERQLEAEARQEEARLRFFPSVSPGIGYRRHDGRIQAVAGDTLDTRKQSLQAGVTLAAQVELGEAYYQHLASKQDARAATEAAAVRRLDIQFAAAVSFFELARAESAAAVAADAVRLAADYLAQLRAGASTGVVSQVDASRAEVQVSRHRILLRQAEEQRAVASARLAQALHLEPGLELRPNEAQLTPLSLFPESADGATLASQALAQRGELRQGAAQVAAVQARRDAATKGALVPTLGASAFVGGLSGGRGGDHGSFSESEDYAVGLSWRLGPGGLFDRGRVRSAEARERLGRLELDKAREAILREVAEARARAQSAARQLSEAAEGLAAAKRVWELARARRDFGIGVVFEALQAEQDYLRLQLDYLQLIASHNAAQYALLRAVGGTPTQ